jgi:site-specific DNA-methyltransferase (adenine-specific)
MKPYYEQGGIRLYHGDCREILPTLEAGSVGAVVTDPPYGMRWDTDCSRFSAGTRHHRKGASGRDWGQIIEGDDAPFDPTPWLSFPEVILWGANHFAARLPVGTTLVWVKREEYAYGSFLSDAEIGWMKGGYGVYLHKDLSMTAEAKRRRHPSQKPVGLMRWCIERLGLKPGATIIDPYMGSGTTLRASKDLGYNAIGIDINERYCEIAARRLAQGVFDFGDPVS